jgi:hypothetical protein
MTYGNRLYIWNTRWGLSPPPLVEVNQATLTWSV